MNFVTRTHGKWILAGEHAVLRGCPALVFPLSSRYLELQASESSQNLPTAYNFRDSDLRLVLQGDRGQEMELLVWGVLEKACELKNIQRSQLQGVLHLTSTLPVGAGMGASASLCVAITRWLGSLGYVQEAEYYDFARNLENLFHGESSGVDIAVALSNQPLLFSRHGERKNLQPTWKPQWAISYSGQRGVTLECVNKVKKLIAADPIRGRDIDQQMAEAVQLALQALSDSAANGQARLIESIKTARRCFEEWGLAEGAPHQHMQALENLGALATKPTGSGGGGYVLSLWEPQALQQAQATLGSELILC